MKLLRQCYPIMATWGLHRYALAAWLVFQEAVETRQADAIFERIRGYYRRHWIKPAAFDPDPA